MIRPLTSIALCVALMGLPAHAQEPALELTPDWEYVADTVMGGVSRGQVTHAQIEGRDAARLTGEVSLDNNGGFIQMAFDLMDGATFDASAFSGITFDVYGNGAEYDLRLRTDKLARPWESFRAGFDAPATWTTVRIAFDDLVAHRTEKVFDAKGLRRVGILAVGREMDVDIAVSSIGFYR